MTEPIILLVDATPDDDYPIRILRAHLESEEGSEFTDNLEGLPPSNPMLVVLNDASIERAAILRRAIAVLAGETVTEP